MHHEPQPFSWEGGSICTTPEGTPDPSIPTLSLWEGGSVQAPARLTFFRAKTINVNQRCIDGPPEGV